MSEFSPIAPPIILESISDDDHHDEMLCPQLAKEKQKQMADMNESSPIAPPIILVSISDDDDDDETLCPQPKREKWE